MIPQSSSRSLRAAPARASATAAGLLPAALAVLVLGASLCSAALPGGPPAPARTPLASPVVRSSGAERGGAAAPGPAAAAMEAKPVEAGDAATSGTLDLADLDKALSNDLVTLETASLRRLLGESPEFVYDPHDRRDPMVLPWEHLRVRAVALLAEAERALKFGNLELAERLYGMVRTTVGDAERQHLPGQETFEGFRAQADAGSQKVLAEKLRVAQGLASPGGVPGTASAKPAAQLPMWVRANTSGVIYSKKEPVCLVGPYTLKVGDKVPEQPVDVEVVKIEKRAVTYRVAGETFVVGLEEGE